MSARRIESIIDLTIPCESSYSTRNRILQHQDEVIIIDDSLDDIQMEPTDTVKSQNRKGKKTIAENKSGDVTPSDKIPLQMNSSTDKSSSTGHCPICWDKLWGKPLASTKCGHVFCMKCLEQSLHLVRKCPTCRVNLPKKNSYHPLYL